MLVPHGTAMPGGEARFRLSVPGIGLDDYARMQRIMLRAGTPPSRWRGRLLGFAGGVVLAGVGIGLVTAYQIESEFWISSLSDGWVWSANGFEVLLLVLGLLAAMLLAWGVLAGRGYARAIRRLHAGGGGMHGAHELLLGEAGLLWRNDSRITFVPWTEITGAERAQGMLFLLASRISAFWLPEDVLAAHPERSGLLALLGRHVRLPEGFAA